MSKPLVDIIINSFVTGIGGGALILGFGAGYLAGRVRPLQQSWEGYKHYTEFRRYRQIKSLRDESSHTPDSTNQLKSSEPEQSN
jgi:ascorbate-specific PTS system EIIC-type component UlaA